MQPLRLRRDRVREGSGHRQRGQGLGSRAPLLRQRHQLFTARVRALAPAFSRALPAHAVCVATAPRPAAPRAAPRMPSLRFGRLRVLSELGEPAPDPTECPTGVAIICTAPRTSSPCFASA